MCEVDLGDLKPGLLPSPRRKAVDRCRQDNKICRKEGGDHWGKKGSGFFFLLFFPCSIFPLAFVAPRGNWLRRLR